MDVQQRIRDVLVQLRAVDDSKDRAWALQELARISRYIKNSKEKSLTATPRRGVLMEHEVILEVLAQRLPDTIRKQIYPKDKADLEAIVAIELWREAECLVRRPHTFTALRQIPEMQQIIAHTAVAAVSECAGRFWQLRVFARSQDGTRDPDSATSASGTEGSSDDWIEAEACQTYRDKLFRKDTDLFDHLVPALRLCLAAEVAIGMLCPGQPPPPDTVEHAAALAMFVGQAYSYIEAELHNSDNGRQVHDYNIKDSLRHLWGHVPGFLPKERGQQQRDQESNPTQQQQQRDQESNPTQQQQQQRDQESNPTQQQQAGQAAEQQQQQQQQCISPPADDAIPQWDLAPHLDLHMHLPSDQLLLLLLHQSGLLPQQQQQQQQQTGSDPTTIADSSTNGSSSSTTAPDLSFLASHGRHLDRLFSHHWPGAAAVLAAQHAQHGSRSSSSDNHATVMTAVEQLALVFSKVLSDRADDPGCSEESAESAGQQQQQFIVGNTIMESTSALASALGHAGRLNIQQQQQQERVCMQQPDGEQIDDDQQQQQQQRQRWQTAEAHHDGDISSDPGDISSSSSSSVSGDQPDPAPAGHLRVVSLLSLLAGTLVLQFISKQQAAAAAAAAAAAGSSGAVTVGQQLLSLQVLLLLGQVQKLQGLAQQYEHLIEQLSIDEQVKPACNSSSSSSTNPPTGDSTSGSSSTATPGPCATDLQQQQRVLLQRLLECVIGLVQLLRQFDASNTAMTAAAAAAAEQDHVSNNNSNTTSGSSSCGGSVDEIQPLSPAAFFSACGPLAAGVRRQCMQPASAAAAATGVSCTAASSTCSSSCSKCFQATEAAGELHIQHSADPGVVSSSSSSGSGGCHVQGIKDNDLRDLIWQVLVGCCCWDHAAAESNSATLKHVVDGLPALQASIIRKAQMQATQSRSEDLKFAAGVISRYPNQRSGRDLKDLLPWLVIGALVCIPDVVKDCIMHWRLAHLEQQGFDLLRWEAMQQAEQQAKQQEQQWFDSITERITVKSNGFNWIKLERITSEDQAVIYDTKLKQNQWLAALHNQAATAGGYGSAADGSPAAGVGSSSNDDGLQHQLDKGLKAYRQLGLALCQQFKPLYEWHKQWYQQYIEQQLQAKAWWASSDRQQLAHQGCVNKQRLQSQPQQQQQQQGLGDSSSNGGGNLWQNGLYDRQSRCPLCRQEQQQQQQEQQKHNNSNGHQSQQQPPGSSSGIHTSPYHSPAVPYSDPFLWRRLLWQLLGKLSPKSQEFYAHYCAMCPHCTDLELWVGVRDSIIAALWSPPTADVTDLQLCTPLWCTLGFNASRAQRVKQYAKAINTAYLQTHSPAAVVLAKQVLLSLSPLQQSVLPAAELAMYLPSSFISAAGKCLQQQLLGKPMLQGLAHNSCGLTPWHVWWHLGIRRYHALGYHHQQQKQRQGPPQQLTGHAAKWLLDSLGGSSSSNNSGDNSSGSASCAWDVDTMYLDADARLYAVGFATRQLNGAVFGNCETSGGSVNPDDSVSDHHPFNFQDQVLVLMRGCQDALFIQAVGRHTGTPWETLVNRAEAGSELATGLVRHYEQAREHLTASLLERQLSTSVSVLNEPKYPPGPDRWRQKHQHWVSLIAHLLTVAAYVQQSGDQILDCLESQMDGTRLFSSMPTATADVQELALQAPVAFETLIDPVIWWTTQQKILRMNDMCDHCNKQIASSEATFTCADCSTPLYCSIWCLNRNAAQHAEICHKLKDAQERYDAAAGSLGPSARPQQPFSRLLDLVKCTGEGGVLDRDMGVLDNLPPGIVEPLRFVILASQRVEKFTRFSQPAC